MWGPRQGEMKAASDREEAPSLEEPEPNTQQCAEAVSTRPSENPLPKELRPGFAEAVGGPRGEKGREPQSSLEELPGVNGLLELLLWRDNSRNIPTLFDVI